jgi:hypothetical protein
MLKRKPIKTRTDLLCFIFEHPVQAFFLCGTKLPSAIKSDAKDLTEWIVEAGIDLLEAIKILFKLLWKLSCVIGYTIYKAGRIIKIRCHKGLREEYMKLKRLAETPHVCRTCKHTRGVTGRACDLAHYERRNGVDSKCLSWELYENDTNQPS